MDTAGISQAGWSRKSGAGAALETMGVIMIGSIHQYASMAAAFTGSLVEAVEAFTIVLAVGTVRGWRSALFGSLLGVGTLLATAAIFGPAIARVPIHVLQIVIGTLLLLFGVRWLRKAILRSAGVIALHDEDIAFARETQAIRSTAGARSPLRSSAGAHSPLDILAALAAFKAVMLEGIEVIVIVIGIGAASNTLASASIGALAACLLVAAVGASIHRPLSRVPENTLKFIVGLLVCSFGLFWFGEGIGIAWPYADAAIVGLFAGLLVLSRAAARLARQAVATRHRQVGYE
jgi:uncharacterized membrane protein